MEVYPNGPGGRLTGLWPDSQVIIFKYLGDGNILLSVSAGKEENSHDDQHRCRRPD
jgi:hypothetical protein